MTQSPTGTLRRLASNDREQWELLWKAYLSFYETALDDTITQTTWDRLLDPADQPHGFCLSSPDNKLIGIVHYLFHRSSKSQNDCCYLQDLYVSETARGMGVGRRLIEAVYAQADKAEASQVYWLTQDTNATARKLYDRVATLTPFVKYRRP